MGESLRRDILRIFDETFAVTTVLLVIALVVASLGIATALAVLVMEREPQLNTMVAVGASFGQIRAMILWEALLLVATGELLGFSCGLILSQLLIYVINKQSFGWTFMFGVDWTYVLVSLLIILITALLGAIPAIHCAVRKPLALALNDN